jgi:DNA-directed RNA polymerase subunit omega
MPNRFELVLLAASAITLDRENDKNAVIALREIAAKTIQAGDVREGPIHSMLHNAEVNDAKDDTIEMENCYQHADHYFRVMGADA